MNDDTTNQAQTPSRRVGLLTIVGALGAAFLGGFILLGATLKALDPMSFVELVRLEGLDFLLPAGVVAMIGFALEAGIGTALLVGIRRRWVMISAALLVGFFLFLTGRKYYKYAQGTLEDDAAGCGCFGNLVSRTPAEAFWQDFLFMVPALLIGFLGLGRGAMPRFRTAIVGAMTLGVVLFAVIAPGLPLDNVATRLKPGVELSSLCTGSDESKLCLGTLLPETDVGGHWLVLAELDESLGTAVDDLNKTALSGQSLIVLSDATPEESRAFFWSYGPSFEIREVPASLTASLYRTLPRSFYVENGKVTQTVTGWPPVAEGQERVAATTGW